MFDFLNWVRPDWHPSEDDLLLYGDGELPPRKATRIRDHLKQCWPCRVRAEKNERMISRLVDYLNLDFAPNLPLPPSSWQ
jgi:anti-sigma factor RsiW